MTHLADSRSLHFTLRVSVGTTGRHMLCAAERNANALPQGGVFLHEQVSAAHYPDAWHVKRRLRLPSNGSP